MGGGQVGTARLPTPSLSAPPVDLAGRLVRMVDAGLALLCERALGLCGWVAQRPHAFCGRRRASAAARLSPPAPLLSFYAPRAHPWRWPPGRACVRVRA